MLQSKLFPKTKKRAPKGAESANHRLLVRAGFVDQLMSGSWTLLPLGWRVVGKITRIVREEMNNIGAQEILMPLLHPKEIWNETGRWEKAKEVMYQFKDRRGREFALSFTHEEIVMDLLRKHIESFRDLPVAVYHFSTKFRNEPRARSGILRGREFLMKDLYSAHSSEEDFWDYYKKVREAYSKIFSRMGFDFRITEAGGGVFTENVTHEFQVPAEGGEDGIVYCKLCDWGRNQELVGKKEKKKCPKCGAETMVSNSIEVGNIFPFGTSYSEMMEVKFTDENGKQKFPYFGSYGIGTTRVMGAWVEISHDEKGIVWNRELAPFAAHLVELPGSETAHQLYQKLLRSGVEVLWDDRGVSAGEKFAEADLVGIPVRLVVSRKTGDRVEWKERNQEKVEILNLQQAIKKLELGS